MSYHDIKKLCLDNLVVMPCLDCGRLIILDMRLTWEDRADHPSPCLKGCGQWVWGWNGWQWYVRLFNTYMPTNHWRQTPASHSGKPSCEKTRISE